MVVLARRWRPMLMLVASMASRASSAGAALSAASAAAHLHRPPRGHQSRVDAWDPDLRWTGWSRQTFAAGLGCVWSAKAGAGGKL
jgi:hypothetical protein